MSTTLDPPPQNQSCAEVFGEDAETLDHRAAKRMQEREKLRTSKFDMVSAFLMSLLWFVSTFVLLLFLIWIANRIAFGPRPFPPIPDSSSRGVNAEGTERDFEPPGADEIVELAEPAIQETLTAVTDAVSTVAAALDAVTSDFAATTDRIGKGDDRPAGPEGEGDDIIAPHQRWELRFSAKNINGYAQQLDFYKFELGVLGGGVQGVDYAANLSGEPKTRRGESANEERLYFMWVDRSSPLFQFDRQLLQKAGMNLGPGREMLQFVDPELERLLVSIELEYAAEKGYPSLAEIQKTIFESRPQGIGYRFVVIDQRYRKSKK